MSGISQNSTDEQKIVARTALKICFAVVVFLSVTSNGLLVMVLVRNKLMLKAPYTIFILNLGIVDLMTGMVYSCDMLE